MGKNILEKIFGTYSEQQIKKINPIVDKIEALGDDYADMTDEELLAQTAAFKERLAKGETLDDILPEAFACVREADFRVLGKRPFRVQLIGGIVLHQGRIAEMKTGEGKTLTATLPAYLNALTGKGVHIVTVNEYLARTGCEEMGRVYNFLGLSCGLVIHAQTKKEKQLAYACDITYGTNNEFGFDYLRDNMVIYKEQMVQRGHVFCIVDEVDSILIDEARTPLIISGEGDKSTDMYDRADKLVRTMKEHRIKELDDKEQSDDVGDADYVVDEKARTTILTQSGIAKAEKYFALENLSDPENSEISHHINQAVRAHGIMHRDIDYIVTLEGEVMIIDSFTGRMMPGRRFSDGLHQAIEAKEHVQIQKENKTLATITFQNYFRFYNKLSGMTGTAKTEEEEFREIYSLDVVEIPTNKPMIRDDHADAVYKSKKGKYDAVIEQIKKCQEKGQPVLVGTVSIEKSEELSKQLKLNGIKHTVLNAKYHEKEAEIVAQAGKLGTVTISTNMAGRGTDIMLGGNPEFDAKQDMRKITNADGERVYDEDMIYKSMGSSETDDLEILKARELYRGFFKKHKDAIEPLAKQVCEAGGLYIIGTERHESRRIDNQLRGRSGRQGDPGESKFFLSLEDDLMRLFGSERILGMVDKLGLEEDQPIEAKLLSNSIENAQKQLEDQNFARRKNVLNYDDVMNQQRTVVYKQRMEVLDGVDLRDKLKEMVAQFIRGAVDEHTSGENKNDWTLEELKADLPAILVHDEDWDFDSKQSVDKDALTEKLLERADEAYTEKEELFGDKMREVERVVLLKSVDSEWMDHIDAMDDLKSSIGLNAYAQRNPINEYRIQGADMFDAMIAEIRNKTVRTILSVVPRNEIRREEVARATREGFSGANPGAARPAQASRPAAPSTNGVQGAHTPAKAEKKPGRNDPCPCGSGKKYKKCCGANDESSDKE